MHIHVLQSELKRALAVVGHAVASKSGLPILANVHLATDDGRLRLESTDLALGIRAWIGAQVEAEGATTLPYKLLSDVVGGLPNDKVSLTLDTATQAVTLTCGKYTATIKGIEADEFPVIPAVTDNPLVTFPADVLRETINQVAFAAATDDTRPVLAGVYASGGNVGMTFAAADGYRLAQRELDTVPREMFEYIIPARALQELARIIDGDTVEMAVSPTGGQAMFKAGSVELVTRLIDGRYPDIERIIPAQFTTRAVLDTAELVKAVRLARLFAVNSSNIVRLEIDKRRVESDRDALHITANAAEVGDNKAVLDAMVHGGGGHIAINAEYWLDILGAVKTPQVALEMQSEGNPLVVKQVGADGALWILMPMTIR